MAAEDNLGTVGDDMQAEEGDERPCANLDEAPDKEPDWETIMKSIQEGNLLAMAQDKFQSRLIQRHLLRGGPEVVQLIYEKSEPVFMELVRDQFGNYLSQKILEICSAEQFERLFRLLRDQLEVLALDVHGTRAVQKLVDQSVSRNNLPALLEALPGEIAEKLALSVTGFHVVVKLIESLPVQEVDQLLNRLCSTPEKALALGRDQWGCCVLKKCVDRADATLRPTVLDAIVCNTVLLVQDAFGNYVVQHLILQCKVNNCVSRIVDAVKGHVLELSLQKFSSNVLEKCLLHSTDKDRHKIINEILSPPSCLPSEGVRQLLFHQFGNYVLQQALEVGKDPQWSLLVELAKPHVKDMIQSSREEGAPMPSGSLTAEHARRLAIKLAKKHQRLAEGLNVEMADSSGMPMDWMGYGANAYGMFGASPYGQGVWPATAMPGVESLGPQFAGAYGYPFMGWDPNLNAQQLGSQPVKGKKGGKAGGRGKQAGKSRGSAKAVKGPDLRQTAAYSQEVPDDSAPGLSLGTGVPRIVGFWPNYSLKYDDAPEPAPGHAASGQPNRPKGKAKGKAKAAAKTPADTGAACAPTTMAV